MDKDTDNIRTEDREFTASELADVIFALAAELHELYAGWRRHAAINTDAWHHWSGGENAIDELVRRLIRILGL